ncbi:MAG TPA: hypothetical protein PLS50_08805 [Candidatus Dojkabacteria bacterium]|nr:hypothetical protein [Candidatus Dojkabacteria bacterium]
MRLLLKLLAFYSKIIITRNAILGKNVFVGPRARIINGGNNLDNIVLRDGVSFYGTIETCRNGTVELARNTTVRFSSILEASNSIIIGSEVIVSNNVIISDNDSHPTDPDIRKTMSNSDHEGALWGWEFANSAPIIIEDNDWQKSNGLKRSHYW